jgi:hypothetical protein
MSNRRSIAMVGLAIAVVILAGVTHFARLPAWAIVLALVILAGASAQVLTGNHRREPAPFPQSAPVVPPPAEYRRAAIAGVPLPSSRPDYQFRFSASVLWLPATGTTSQKPLNLDAVAADVVLQRAREITRERDPELATLAQHDLARILGEMHSDSSGAVRAMAESVQLTLPDEDFQRLEKMAAIRKNEDIWEHERKYEQNRRKYLGEDALKSPGSAVVWWLARIDDQVDKVVPNIDQLTHLSYAANNTSIPQAPRPAAAPEPEGDLPSVSRAAYPPSWHATENGASATDHFDAFMHAIGIDENNPDRILFARQVARIVSARDQAAASDIARTFDAPGDADTPVDDSAAGEPDGFPGQGFSTGEAPTL